MSVTRLQLTAVQEIALHAFYVACVEPRLEFWAEDMDKRLYKGLSVGRARGMLETGDPVVIVTGWKSGSGYTNTMRLINVPETDEGPILGTPIVKGYND